MPLDLWLAFAAASAILLASPGPTILPVTARARRGEGGGMARSGISRRRGGFQVPGQATCLSTIGPLRFGRLSP